MRRFSREATAEKRKNFLKYFYLLPSENFRQTLKFSATSVLKSFFENSIKTLNILCIAAEPLQ